jgi:hypothetical protein
VLDDEIAIDPYISSEGAHVLHTSYCSIPNLKHLHACPSPFDINTLTHFSISRTLTILEIIVPSHVFEQFSSTKHIWPVYDCLKHLYIDTEDLSSAHTFLDHQGFQCLQKLELSRYKPEVVWDIPAFFASVRSSNISLNRLTLSDTVLSTLSLTPPCSLSICEDFHCLFHSTALPSYLLTLKGHLIWMIMYWVLWQRLGHSYKSSSCLTGATH